MRTLPAALMAALLLVSPTRARGIADGMPYPDELRPTPAEFMATREVVVEGTLLDVSGPLDQPTKALPTGWRVRIQVTRVLHGAIEPGPREAYAVVRVPPAGAHVLASGDFLQDSTLLCAFAELATNGDVRVGAGQTAALRSEYPGSPSGRGRRFMADVQRLLGQTPSARLARAEGLGLFRVIERARAPKRTIAYSVELLKWLVPARRAPTVAWFSLLGVCTEMAAPGDTLLIPVVADDGSVASQFGCLGGSRLRAGFASALDFHLATDSARVERTPAGLRIRGSSGSAGE